MGGGMRRVCRTAAIRCRKAHGARCGDGAGVGGARAGGLGAGEVEQILQHPLCLARMPFDDLEVGGLGRIGHCLPQQSGVTEN